MPTGMRNLITFSFLFILVLTAIAAVIANLGLFALDPNSNFAKTTLGAVLLEIVSAVIVVWKSGVLAPSFVSATIKFPQNVESIDIDLDISGCCYEIRDSVAKIKASGRINLVFGNGGWECRLPAPNDPDESITLTLKEKNGRVWEVRPFYLSSRDVSAIIRR